MISINKNGYVHYKDVTREILDAIKVGDLIRVNDWEEPMCVKAVSENYFVMTQDLSGVPYYSVCSKLPFGYAGFNNMINDMFHCGTDNYIFGSPISIDYPDMYHFNNEETNKMYLQEFEDGKCELSLRTSIPIYDLYVKG